MHNVLDLRDLVPDEIEQLTLIGIDCADVAGDVGQAFAAGDLSRLDVIYGRLESVLSSPQADVEPSDEYQLRALAMGAQSVDAVGSRFQARLWAAWTGRMIGNTIGKPIEGLPPGDARAYLDACGQIPLTGFLPLLDPLPDSVGALHPSAPTSTVGHFDMAPRDDDLDWTILGLHILETRGMGFTTNDVADAWLDCVPFTQTFTAERAAYRNLIHGLRPPETATFRNPYREWIGALIRADIFGYVYAGQPGMAASAALTDARLSHTANGVYGEMWAAALVSLALVAESMTEAVHGSLATVPSESRLARTLSEICGLHDGDASVEEALAWVDEKLGHYPWVHVIPNSAVIACALLWGRSFLDAVEIALRGGRDTDSSAATVGCVYAALHGPSAIPPELVTTHRYVHSSVRGFDGISVDELVQRTLAVRGAL